MSSNVPVHVTDKHFLLVAALVAIAVLALMAVEHILVLASAAAHLVAQSAEEGTS